MVLILIVENVKGGDDGGGDGCGIYSNDDGSVVDGGSVDSKY